ncbi:MAG: transketolase family protein [Dehalococcoidia bacterium]|nr:transketolase family protein [Dehalococcoidia bacterium]
MEQSTREAYGRVLVELGRENTNIVVLDADLSKSTQTNLFAAAFPDRFFDCGIAEQNMIGIAAGLASSGKTVFASTFAVFVPGRCFDQMRMSLAQPSLNVKVVTSHGGITVGEDGTSHHAIEDLALACALPGFRVIVPADALETVQAVRIAAQTYGPFYIRLSRPKTPLVYGADYQFSIGKAARLTEGKDLTVIATGVMVAKAVEAAKNLAREGIGCRVLSMSTLKPLDQEAVISAAEETGAIITAEEHMRTGGMGSAIAQVVSERAPVPMYCIAINDLYSKSGKPEELLEKRGLTSAHIETAARSLVAGKK